MINFPEQLGQATLAALLLPVSLLVILLFVRLVAQAERLVRRERPLPIVVHPLNFEHGLREFLPAQPTRLIELPSRLRDFIADDSSLVSILAPGPISPITPKIASATPETQTAPSWAATLQELVYPRDKPSYNLILVPEMAGGGYAVGVQIVISPSNELVAARSFRSPTMKELTLRIGSFAIETLLEQTPMLRRAPRWEHWRAGAYELFRAGQKLEEADLADEAHSAYSQAALRSPGNTRLALHHGNLHESLGQYAEAAQTYFAASCLWPQNVELSYRFASAQVNQALSAELALEDKINLIQSAIQSLLSARDRVRTPFVYRRLLRTLRPHRRDPGERRFWFSWLRPDPYRKPLRLLRRTKGFEYRSALSVAIDANWLLLAMLVPENDSSRSERDAVACWRSVTKVVSRRRSGWLAHWGAACFFSRASELVPSQQPDATEWLAEWNSIGVGLTGSRPQLGSPYEVDDWKAYCEQRALAELGRVLRNPCSQLNLTLLRTDPDMKRLQNAFRGQSVSVLAGLGPHRDESIFDASLRSTLWNDDEPRRWPSLSTRRTRPARNGRPRGPGGVTAPPA